MKELEGSCSPLQLTPHDRHMDQGHRLLSIKGKNCYIPPNLINQLLKEEAEKDKSFYCQEHLKKVGFYLMLLNCYCCCSFLPSCRCGSTINTLMDNTIDSSLWALGPLSSFIVMNWLLLCQAHPILPLEEDFVFPTLPYCEALVCRAHTASHVSDPRRDIITFLHQYTLSHRMVG